MKKQIISAASAAFMLAGHAFADERPTTCDDAPVAALTQTAPPEPTKQVSVAAPASHRVAKPPHHREMEPFFPIDGMAALPEGCLLLNTEPRAGKCLSQVLPRSGTAAGSFTSETKASALPLRKDPSFAMPCGEGPLVN